MKKLIILLLFSSMSSLCADGSKAIKKFLDYRDELVPTSDILVKAVGETVCVDQSFTSSDGLETQPMCSFVMNFSRRHHKHRYGITEKGWFWNSEEQISTESVEIAQSGVVKYYGRVHTMRAHSLPEFLKQDPEHALATGLNDLMSNVVTAGGIESDRKAQEDICRNQRQFIASHVGSRMVLPEEISRRLH